MFKIKSIQQIIFLSIAFMILVVSGALMFMVLYQYQQFQKDALEFESRYLQSKQKQVRFEVNKIINSVLSNKKRADTVLMEKLKKRVSEAYNTAMSIYTQNHKTHSRAMISRQIHDTLFHITWDNNLGYYFAIDQDGVVQIHRNNPELEQKNVINLQDSQGVYFIQEFKNIIVAQNEGYIKYYWQKPSDKNKMYPKFTYVKHFEPLDWIIGTGSYLDAIEKQLQQSFLEEINNINFINFAKLDYFLIFDEQGNKLTDIVLNLMETKNHWEFSAQNDIKLKQNIIQAAQKPQGDFVFWPQSLEQSPLKLFYANRFTEWNWIISAGIYLNETEKVVGINQDELEIAFKQRLMLTTVIFFLVTLLALLIARIFAGKIRHEFETFSSFLAFEATQNRLLDKDNLAFLEFVGLAKTTNEMILKRQDIEKNLLTAKEKAETATRSKNEFLTNMSHEIRTPINGILGGSQLLSDTSLNAQQQQYLEIINTSAESLLIIINDILDFSKIEAGKLKLNTVDFNLHHSIQTVVELLQANAYEKGIELKTKYGNDIPTDCHGDSGRLRQILINLIGNAIKFTSQGGITVAVEKVEILPPQFEKTTGEFVTLKISVIDTGIGIDTRQCEQLFEKFTQADGSSTREFGGTGLGLSICHRLIELMGGEIGVISKKGQGSTFWFTVTLPIVTAPLAVSSPLESPSNTKSVSQLSKTLNILLVEDNHTNQMVAKIVLRKMGYNVTIANNGKEAVEKTATAAFDIVLMDLQMPVMNGYQATKAIRQREQQQGKSPLTIIAMTAHSMSSDKEQCFAVGMNDYLLKPFKREKLQEKLLQWL